MSLAVIEVGDLEALIDGIVERRLQPLVDSILNKPDETILADEDAAQRKGVSVSTLRRMKQDGRVGSIPTPRGRLCRVCDLKL